MGSEMCIRDRDGARIWFLPERGGHYILGVDPGQGKITETVAVVLRIFQDRGPQYCARLSGLIDPMTFGAPLKRLALMYGMPHMVPEANGHGLGLMAQLSTYPNMYWREDVISGQRTMVRGWLTTPRNKPFVMQMLGMILPGLECYDATFIRQCRGFRDDGTGRIKSTGLDDIHDAAALAAIGIGSANIEANLSTWEEHKESGLITPYTLREPQESGLIGHMPTWPK